MALGLATWSARRMRTLWGAGLLSEVVLLLAMFAVLVPPDPPLVARLRENTGAQRTSAVLSAELRPGAVVELRPGAVAEAVAEDSFYTVLHWPLDKPLLAGGGRVLAIPMRLWWVPALYVGAVPLLLLGLTGAWLLARHRALRADAAS